MRDDNGHKAARLLAGTTPVDAALSTSIGSSANSQSVLRPGVPVDVPYDDAHALPRFLEPPLSLPDHQRSFVRAIAVKPGVVFFTWDVAKPERHGHLALQVHAKIVVVVPRLEHDHQLLEQLLHTPARTVGIDVGSNSYYLGGFFEREAVACQLVRINAGHVTVLSTSNITLLPPSRPAPDGPLWQATLPPSMQRSQLTHGRLLRGEVPAAALVTRDSARAHTTLEPPPELRALMVDGDSTAHVVSPAHGTANSSTRLRSGQVS